MKGRSKEVRIAVKSTHAMLQEALEACKRADRGEPPIQPVNKIYFEDEAMLLETLSPKRMELLRHLRHAGPMSIRQLSEQLHRDYKNVHTDVVLLTRLELIKKSRSATISVPWDLISVEIKLAA